MILPGQRWARRIGATFLLMLCAACSGGAPGGRVATPSRVFNDAPARQIVLVHRSGEKLDVTYWRRGSGYDGKAMDAISRMLRDRKADQTARIAPELVDYMAALIYRLGLPPETAIEVLSGYRSPSTNAALARGNGRVARESWHMNGMAVDIRIPGLTGRATAEIAKTLQRGGAAWYDDSDHIHLDVGPIRTWNAQTSRASG